MPTQGKVLPELARTTFVRDVNETARDSARKREANVTDECSYHKRNKPMRSRKSVIIVAPISSDCSRAFGQGLNSAAAAQGFDLFDLNLCCQISLTGKAAGWPLGE
jgi:hypothetical protein